MLTGRTNAIGKILSPNDVGETGAHQVGIYISKDPRVLGFFPALDPSGVDPSVMLNFIWAHNGTQYSFRFVYYNGKLTGRSTRDEYRLTQMTDFMRDSGMRSGDMLVLYRDGNNWYISNQPPTGGAIPHDQNWVVVL